MLNGFLHECLFSFLETRRHLFRLVDIQSSSTVPRDKSLATRDDVFQRKPEGKEHARRWNSNLMPSELAGNKSTVSLGLKPRTLGVIRCNKDSVTSGSYIAIILLAVVSRCTLQIQSSYTSRGNKRIKPPYTSMISKTPF